MTVMTLIFTTICLAVRRFRLIAALLPVCVFPVTASAQDGSISIGKMRASAGEVMQLIESQGGYHFTYNQNILDTAKVYNFPHTEMSVKDALDNIVKNTGLGYVIRNRHIAFVPASAVPAAPVQPVPFKTPTAPVPANMETRGMASEERVFLPAEAKAEIWSDTAAQITILFRFDSAVVDDGFMDNAKNLKMLHKLLTDAELLSKLDSIVIRANSSPDGNPDYNKMLARKRAEAIKAYTLRNYPHVGKSIIRTYSQQEGYWNRLIKIVAENPNIPGRNELRALLENPGLSDVEKSLGLNSINDGKTFAYLRDNLILRSIRTGTIISFIYASPELPSGFEPESEPEPIPGQIQTPPETVLEPVVEPGPISEPAVEPEPVPESAVEPEPAAGIEAGVDAVPEYVTVHPAALRTNLLLDIVGGANIGVEIPIGNHFSIAGDFMYARTRIANLYALQTLQGTLEARYWFKLRRNILTGWNLGLYGTYSNRFDIQWGGGLQGDGYWSGGLSCGYSFPLSNSFNLDLSAMGGFVYAPRIREYGRPEGGHLMWNKTRYNVSRISLTMIRANLVWLINKKVAK